MNLTLKNTGLFSQAPGQQVVELPVDQVTGFKNHPYRVRDDEDMAALTTSIEAQGIQVPLLVRPQDSGFELVSGHRRLHAARLLGLEKVPALVAQMSDDVATVLMVDSNLTRTHLLVSEKATAYRLRSTALKHQGTKGESTRTVLAQQVNESEASIARLVRLGGLDETLLRFMDEKRIPMSAGLELTGLSQTDQSLLASWLEAHDGVRVNARQAQGLTALASSTPLSEDQITALLSQHVSPVTPRVKVDRSWLPDDLGGLSPLEWVRKAIDAFKEAQ